MRQRLAAWILLLTGISAMGLLPISAHLCCSDTDCCGEITQPVKACCAPDEEKKACAQDEDCCEDVAFFNLAPLFTEKIHVHQGITCQDWEELPVIIAYHRLHCSIKEHAAVVIKPPDISHLPPYLACRRLLI